MSCSQIYHVIIGGDGSEDCFVDKEIFDTESGFQYTIDHMEITERFHLELGEAVDAAIEEALWKMDEVNDVVVDVDGFDVVLGTAYAPNYNEDDYSGVNLVITPTPLKQYEL